ncbi:hypothetical protein RJ639_040890 [Escallonia herrerae]|uniref:Protein PLANT CADMIUM RESISTANCE 8 n=1 Tax=Escallonia herrerae TaxID=1293975 RepID=A0AA89B5N7_9ASTE|nr:hypothetical protein RJ639_040890 [Escallonia herrerae]
MGRIELHELNARVQQSAQPAAVPMVVQHQGHPRVGMVQNLVIGQPWTTGLFDCHEHQTNVSVRAKLTSFSVLAAVMTAFLPCVTFGQIAEILDGGEMCKASILASCLLGSFIYALMMPPLCSQWIMGSKYRTKLRTRYDLVEAPYEDRISHIFCSCCSLCQEFRELKNRGLDPALGKHRTSQFF